MDDEQTDEAAAVNELRLWLSSVPMYRMDDTNGPPQGMASGCLLDYGGKRILLTVSHATKQEGRWAIQLRYEPGKGTVLHSIGAMNFLQKRYIGLSKRRPELIDLSYASVPSSLQAWRQEIEPITNAIQKELPIRPLVSDLTAKPKFGATYGFCGQVMHEWEAHPGQQYLNAQTRIYTGLTYSRTEDDFHYFSLPFAHPGHDHFRGCSGAPMLSETGELVALVCGGVEESGEVYGIALRTYKVALDIEVGNI
jgi:hypothetical protein